MNSNSPYKILLPSAGLGMLFVSKFFMQPRQRRGNHNHISILPRFGLTLSSKKEQIKWSPKSRASSFYTPFGSRSWLSTRETHSSILAAHHASAEATTPKATCLSFSPDNALQATVEDAPGTSGYSVGATVQEESHVSDNPLGPLPSGEPQPDTAQPSAPDTINTDQLQLLSPLEEALELVPLGGPQRVYSDEVIVPQETYLPIPLGVSLGMFLPGEPSDAHNKLFQVGSIHNSAVAAKNCPLTINLDEHSLSIVVSDNLDRNSVQKSYQDMDDLLRVVHGQNRLSTVSRICLQLPKDFDPQPIDFGVTEGVSVITPCLKEFEWHGSISGLPNPWRELMRLDLFTLERLIIKDCSISEQDCIFLLDHASRLQHFEVDSVSNVSSVTKYQPSGMALGCSQLELVDISTDTELVSMWTALQSCGSLKTINISTLNENAHSNIVAIPYSMRSLMDVNIGNAVQAELEERLTEMVVRFGNNITVQGRLLLS